MMQALSDFLSLSQATLLSGFIVFLRVGAAMAVVPAFGEQSIPVRIRVGIAMAFTVIVTATMLPDFSQISNVPHIRLLATETIAGLSIGIVIRFFIFSLQVAGAIAAQSTSLSQLFGGESTEPLPAIGHLFVVAGLALAVGAGLHVKLVEIFILSYGVLPAGKFPEIELWTSWELRQVSRMFGLAFALAAPFVAASLIYNVTLGVINRAMPQLMVAFVGAPAITAGGLLLLVLTAPFLLSIWLEALNTFLVSPFTSY